MSWEQLLSIVQEAAAERRAEATTPRVACPHDGEPLSAGPHGELFCTFDGWRPGGGGSTSA